MSWFTLSNGETFRAVRFPKSTHMLVSDYPDKFAQEVSAVLRG